MKVDLLKIELRKRGISTSGKKTELLEKLRNAMRERIPLVAEATTSVAPSGFDVRARWRLLLNVKDAEEPTNEDPALLDPSEARDKRVSRGNSADDANMNDRRVTLVTKKNYSEKFVRNEFSAMALQPVKINTKNTKSKLNMKRKSFQKDEVKYEKQPVKNLLPNIKFLEKHRLDSESHPADWVRSFIPELQAKGDSKGSSISRWCQYTNMKAAMDFAGNASLG